MITKTQVIAWIRVSAEYIAENKELLTALDATIGDADHGVNMHRGFEEVLAKLPSLAASDIGALLKGVGMTLLSRVGGASGPLYGTLFMRLGLATSGKEMLSAGELAAGLASGVDGIQSRGSAQVGEKTMVDALLPAVNALQHALAEGMDLYAALQAASRAAEEGMRGTIPLQATKGRASYLGLRSVGHQDPGATSAYLLMRAAADTIGQDTKE